MKLREYQQNAINEVHNHWDNGRLSVCLVSPTGSGKTIMGVSCIEKFKRPLWIVHRNELVSQASERLPLFSSVITVQNMLSTGRRPLADVVVFDESHHYVADQWKKVSDAYSDIPKLGLTATPQRQDGRSLGDLFFEIVVAASYSELINLGHIVPCKIYRPMYEIGDGIALDPVSAYKDKADGTQAFLFAPTVKNAQEFSQQFNDNGIPSETIHGKMRLDDRRRILSDFKSGKVKILCNVYILTEGVDVPAAETVIFARGVSHPGPFMQMAGRVLRPANGKTHAIVLDLPGLTYIHGSPTSDRQYSLSGDSNMKSSEAVPFKQCPQCAQLIRKTRMVCDECGYQFPEAIKDIKIYNAALIEVYDGNNTPDDAKIHEWNRLKNLITHKNWSIQWAIKQYQKLFPGEYPQLKQDEKISIFKELKNIQLNRGYKPGFVKVRYKQITGEWP